MFDGEALHSKCSWRWMMSEQKNGIHKQMPSLKKKKCILYYLVLRKFLFLSELVEMYTWWINVQYMKLGVVYSTNIAFWKFIYQIIYIYIYIYI